MVRTKSRGEGEKFRLGSGFLLLYRDNLEVDDDELGLHVALELEVEDNRLVVTSFCARRLEGGPPVTAEALKSVPLVRWTQLAASGGFLSGLVRSETTAPGNYKATPATDDDLNKLPEVERAAVVYRGAYFVGLPPTSTVAEVLGVNKAVAAKRVQAARRAGLLEPTVKGKKGA